jgi:hypothetical protein
MKNPTVQENTSVKHGSDASYQYSMTTNEIALAQIIAERFQFKPTMDAIIQLRVDLNAKFGTSI